MSLNQTSIESSGTIILRSCGDTPRAKLAAILTDAGLSHSYLPNETSTLDALKAALTSLYSGRNGLRVEPLRGGTKGYGLMRVEKDTSRDLRGACEIACEYLRASSFEQINVRFHRTPDDGEQVRIHAQVAHEREMVDASRVSIMLTNVLLASNAVALPGNGGVYWVPKQRAPFITALVKACAEHTTGVRIYLVVAQLDDASVQTAIAGIREKAIKLVTEIQTDLTSGLKEPSALRNRIAALKAAAAQFAEYESSLGIALPDIREGVSNCETAVLMAEAGCFDASVFMPIGMAG